MKFLVFALFVGLVGVIDCGGIRGSRGIPKEVLTGTRGKRSPATSDQEAPVLRSESIVNVDGFKYAFETGNGITAEAAGELKKVGAEEAAISVRGQFKYTSPEGTPIGLSYVADENGYQPVGDHIPVPPAIPEAILRSLEYIKNHPAPVEQVAYKKP